MTVGPDRFKQHAERVADEFEDEIAYRSAISRGYYCAFHHTKQTAESYNERISEKGRAHREVRKFLERNGHNTLARDLKSLRGDRNEADYDISDENIEDMDWAIFRNELSNFILDLKQI